VKAAEDDYNCKHTNKNRPFNSVFDTLGEGYIVLRDCLDCHSTLTEPMPTDVRDCLELLREACRLYKKPYHLYWWEATLMVRATGDVTYSDAIAQTIMKMRKESNA